MKKFILSILVIFIFISFASCNQKDTSPHFDIEVIDEWGNSLGKYNCSTANYKTVFDAFNDKFNVVYYDGEFGKSITSINNTFVDNNWYLALYENDVPALTGIDGLVIDDGDYFKFKLECWNTVSSGYGTMDEYDILVDKIIYSYAKNYLSDNITSQTSFKSGVFWDYLLLNLMNKYHYDETYFKKIDNQNIVNELNNYDVNTLNNGEFTKYYVISKYYNLDLNNFKTAFLNFVNNNMSDKYEAYTTCFYLLPLYNENIESTKISSINNTPLNKDISFGPDDSVWQILSEGLYNEYSYEDVEYLFDTLDYQNGCSNALILEVYAYLNKSPREEGHDYIKTLIDNYYDNNLKLIKGNMNETTTSYSTNQIYLALASYKVQRDNNVKVNIFNLK